MRKWLGKLFVWLWRCLLAVFDFLSLLEDEKPGAPRRLSQTKIMVWGAMAVGAFLVLNFALSGAALGLTETGLIGLLTVAAGLMKMARDRRRDRDDDFDDPPPFMGSHFDRGGPDGL